MRIVNDPVIRNVLKLFASLIKWAAPFAIGLQLLEYFNLMGAVSHYGLWKAGFIACLVAVGAAFTWRVRELHVTGELYMEERDLRALRR